MIPLGAQIAAVRREIAMRERVYPGWTASGRMTQAKAEHEIAAMKAVLETLLDVERKDAEAAAYFGEALR